MKKFVPILPVIAAASFLFVNVPRSHAQSPPGDDTTLIHTAAEPTPTASPEEQPDVFDALKKGLTKVQKQTKEAKEMESQVKALKKQQDAMQQELIEGKERLHAVLVHQAEEIKDLQTTVARLETELKTLKPAAPVAPPGPIGVPAQP